MGAVQVVVIVHAGIALNQVGFDDEVANVVDEVIDFLSYCPQCVRARLRLTGRTVNGRGLTPT